MPRFDVQTVQLAIFAVIALALLLQAIVLLAIFFSLRKAVKAVREQIEELRSSVQPILDNTRQLFIHVGPRLEEAAQDLATLTRSLRVQTSDIQASATEILERIRRQASRVESMTAAVLDAIDHVGAFMTDAVAKPMRQFSGVLASARAVVESLRASAAAAPHAQPPQPARNPNDADTFI